MWSRAARISTAPADRASPGGAMFNQHRAQNWIASRGIDRNAPLVPRAWVGPMFEEQLCQQPHLCAAARRSARACCRNGAAQWRRNPSLVARVGIGAAREEQLD